MTESIIVAIITGALALVGSLISSNATQKLTGYKVDELKSDFSDLKTKVEKHNNLVERMVIVEQSVKSAHKRLDEMKGEH